MSFADPIGSSKANTHQVVHERTSKTKPPVISFPCQRDYWSAQQTSLPYFSAEKVDIATWHEYQILESILNMNLIFF